MKYLLLLIYVLFCTLSYSQNDIEKAMIELDKKMTNYSFLRVDTQYYNTGEPHKLFFYDTNEVLRKTVVLDVSGNLKRLLNRNKKDELDGLVLSFYETGKLKSFSIYNGGVGFSTYYYEDGRIKKYTQSKDTYLTGYEASFCSEGELYSEIFHDSLDYVQKGYHCNGILRFQGRIINNEQKEGKWEYWNKDGILIREEIWEKGNLVKKEVFEVPDKKEE